MVLCPQAQSDRNAIPVLIPHNLLAMTQGTPRGTLGSSHPGQYRFDHASNIYLSAQPCTVAGIAMLLLQLQDRQLYTPRHLNPSTMAPAHNVDVTPRLVQLACPMLATIPPAYTYST